MKETINHIIMNKSIIMAIVLAGFTNAVAQTTIYTADGTLSSNRIVTLNSKTLNFKSTAGNFFINGTNGFTGINTISPTTALDVNGDIKGTTGIFTKFQPNGQTYSTVVASVNSAIALSAGSVLPVGEGTRVFNFMDYGQSNYNSTPTVWLSINNRNANSRLRFMARQDGESNFYLFDKNQVTNFLVEDNGSNRITLYMGKPDSRVCIGTTSSTDGTDVYSLSVNGNVRADRVKVYTTWADHVFEKGYKLPTLEEVEKHIKEKGHLQDIPSAKEVEAKGIDLGNMNKLLLQKIEELTLYTIQLNKQVQELKANANKQ